MQHLLILILMLGSPFTLYFNDAGFWGTKTVAYTCVLAHMQI